MAVKLFALSLHVLAASAGFMEGLPYPRPPLPTAFVHPIEKRQNINACITVYSAINFCESVSPGFTTMAATNQAPCLCYSSTSWRPSIFDGQIQTCANYARTASPSDYSAINALSGFCSSVGDIRTLTTTRGSSGGLGSGPAACSVLASAVSYCESVTPGFTTAPVTAQAPCLCYSSGTWRPSIFDGLVATCVNYAQTASPSDAPAIERLENFCTSVGDVRSPAGNTASTTSRFRTPDDSTPTTTGTRPTITGIATYPACSYVGAAISFCNSVSPGFTTMEPSSQAPCLCYSSSTWNPTGFDGPVSSCANFVRTAQPSDYALFSNLAGFCTDVGDVFAQTTSSRSSSSGSQGIGGLPGDVFPGTTTSSSRLPTSTVTVQPPTSSARANAAGPAAVANHWAVKLVTVFMVVLV